MRTPLKHIRGSGVKSHARPSPSSERGPEPFDGPAPEPLVPLAPTSRSLRKPEHRQGG